MQGTSLYRVTIHMEKDGYQEKLLEIRGEIDAIDEKLLPLFLQRMNCSERVAEIKRGVGIPVYAPKREQEILDRVAERAGAYGPSAKALYSAMMAVSRARQHQLLEGGEELRRLEKTARRTLPAPSRVVCQGVEGAYSHKAANMLYPQAPIAFVPDFRQVFAAVEEEPESLGVLPVENSAAGSVTAVYDLILQYRFYIVGAVDVKVEHCLAAAGEGPVRRVVSHPQGLSQCGEYIKAHGLETVEYSNTAAAAQFVAQERPAGTAAICSEEAAEKYGLKILERGIQNEKNNTTRFVVISKEPLLPEDATKISLCFSLPHTTGSLYNVLERFAVCGLNLTKIESRPIPGSAFEYDFYLDFTGCLHHPQTLALICALHDELPRFSFLGNYDERQAAGEA